MHNSSRNFKIILSVNNEIKNLIINHEKYLKTNENYSSLCSI